jgi:hypothetical protein
MLGSMPAVPGMTLDATATARCICSSDFTAQLMTDLSSTNPSAQAAALSTLCSADCKGLLDMTFASMGALFGGAGSDVSAVMGDMVNCMCASPDFLSLIYTTGSSTPSQSQIDQICQTSACSSMVSTLSASDPSGPSCNSVTPVAVTTVEAVVYASGTVSDYAEGSSANYQLKAAFAAAAGVSASDVALTVTSGSVRIVATITVPSGTTASVVKTSLENAIGSTTTSATTALGITVVDTVTVSQGTSGGGDNPCFHRDATACRVLDAAASPAMAYGACFNQEDRAVAALVRMGDLLAGDVVLSVGADLTPEFARVVVNQHTEVEMRSSLLNLKFAGGSLALTPDHVLFVDGAFVGARHVRAGSILEPGGAVVEQVELMNDAVVNPITSNSRILAAGASGGSPVVSATHPEWIAEWMLTSSILPLPFSMSNLLSYLFPATVQSFYNKALEPVAASMAPGLKVFKAAAPSPLIVFAFVAFDFGISSAFLVYSLLPLKIASLFFAMVTVSKLLARKA